MGKMRLKLSRVMPHAWFYKLREVGNKPGASQFKSSDATHKSVYTSPINHKAIDIPFPADTPKRSPHIEPPPQDFIALDQIHLLELSDECRPSIILPYAPASENIMSLPLEEDNLYRIPSAPDTNASGCPPPCGLNFDVRELERRLKALDLEDRGKNHSSPLLLSVSVPSPMLNGIPYTSIKGSLRQKGLDGYSLDTCDAHEYTSNVYIADEFSLDIHHGCEGEQESPLLHVAYASDERQSEGYVHIVHEGLCGSLDESNRHSTSSSDTGFERGSSSMWERDVFSITSDGSEAFTVICPNEVEPAYKSRHHLWKVRERMSPSLYGDVHIDHGMSRVSEDNQEVGLAEDDMVSGFSRNRYVAAGVQDVRRQVSHAGCKESHMGDCLYAAPHIHNEMSQLGDVGRIKRGSQYRIQMPFSIKSSDKGEEGTSVSTGKHEVAMHKSFQSVPHNDKKVGSFSLPDDRNDCLSVNEDSSDDRLSVHSRLSTGRFSYARCKERLLSSRTFVEQPQVNMAKEVLEEQTLSNYAKFKLKQRGLLHSKGSASNVGMYLDPGLFNTVLRRDELSQAHENSTTSGVDLSSAVSMPDQCSEHLLLHRQSTSSYHSKSRHIQPRDRISNVQDQGPSSFKGTQRALRERMRGPIFEQFSLSTSEGGTPSNLTQSRVFDSFAMVKCSYDPRHDFKESMVEMIMEKGLHSSHDMVELLQCYLTLNADVYHDTIVKVFTEVWSDMFQHI